MAKDLDAASITPRLRGSFGAAIEVHDRIDSTNRRALEWAGEGAPHGATVVADAQSAGRGRLGRTWFAEPGTSLLFSVIVRPANPLGIELLPVGAGVAIARVLDRMGVTDVRLKWPNDLLIRGAKVGGILVESRVDAGAVQHAVIGVGINVTGSTTELSRTVGRAATALAPEHVGAIGRAELLVECLGEIERVWASLEAGRTGLVVEEAERRLPLLGRDIDLRMPDGSLRSVTALRLLPSGALEVAEDGRIGVVTSGEVERVHTLP